MDLVELCCIKVLRHNNKLCGGHRCNVDEGDRSYLTLLANETKDFTVVSTNYICLVHRDSYLKPKLDRCVATGCKRSRYKKGLRKCPANMLIYLNLHETAQVNIHQSCYLRLKQLLQPNSNFSTSNNNNNNNPENQPPIIDTRDRTAEIAAHEYFTAKQSITPPGSPIQTNGKRGRSKTWHHIPRGDKNYKDCSPPSKHQKVQAAKSFIRHLTHNNSGTEEGNRENRISFLTDLINCDKENFFPAIERSQFRTQAFKLTSDQTIELRNKINLTWNQQRLLRSYLKSINRNILPPEYIVRNQQTEYEYQFEADTVKLNNDLITYVRVSDPVLLIQQQLAALKANNQLTSHDNLIPENEIWLNLLGDKGGHSTKLMVSILNTIKPLSRNQILLALYEGAGEEYEIVKEIFGPIFDQLYQWANNINNDSASNQKIRIFVGGDMMYLWMLHGLSQCGTHFCVYCKSKDRSSLDELRNYDHHMQQLQLFNSAGRIMNSAQQYFNCINEPIIGENAFINTSPMPLHTFLGVAKICLDIMKDLCIEADKSIAKSKTIPNNIPTTDELNELHNNIQQGEHEIAAIDIAYENILAILNGYTDYIPDESNSVELNNQIKQLLERKKQLEQEIAEKVEKWNSVKGYFLHQFEQFLLTIKVFHKGNFGHSLVGSEAHKLFHKENIIEMTDILRSNAISQRNNEFIKYGNDIEADKLQQLLEIISVLYKLSTAARKLDPNEIETIKTQSSKLLSHYTTNYPNRSITPKLHNLIHHFPVLAETHQTIGLLSEHAIESMHRRFKLYDSAYCNIRDPIKQLLYCIRLHTLAIDARLTSKKNALIR